MLLLTHPFFFHSYFCLQQSLSTSSPSWSQCRKELAGAHRSKAFWDSACFWGHGESGDFSWTSSTSLLPNQRCQGQWEGLASRYSILTRIESFTWGLSRSAHGKYQPQFTPLPLSCPTAGHCSGRATGSSRRDSKRAESRGIKVLRVYLHSNQSKTEKSKCKASCPLWNFPAIWRADTRD